MLKKLFRRIAVTLLLLWFMLTLVVGMWVWNENSSPVVVSYFGFEFHDQALGTVMTGMFVAGFLLGAFPMFVTAAFRESAHKRHVKKMVKEFGRHDSADAKLDTERLNHVRSREVGDRQGSDSDKLKLKVKA